MINTWFHVFFNWNILISIIGLESASFSQYPQTFFYQQVKDNLKKITQITWSVYRGGILRGIFFI